MAPWGDRIIAGIWRHFTFLRGCRETQQLQYKNQNINFKVIFISRLQREREREAETPVIPNDHET